MPNHLHTAMGDILRLKTLSDVPLRYHTNTIDQKSLKDYHLMDYLSGAVGKPQEIRVY